MQTLCLLSSLGDERAHKLVKRMSDPHAFYSGGMYDIYYDQFYDTYITIYSGMKNAQA